ncbi:MULTISPECIES: xylulokinase [unclassified Aureimonas]|uniref:xylulokinase n=1 Tax=unclassified Aureimonas TaxID=2615206 RepID=UPI0006F59CB0|nr:MULTISPECIES: xylulokinase [unclassified Aureimonas]KQT55399.1 xylulose kinase [Aureimonas sp. Leaf427]KQT71188.1 xylulose kinase [Aureimonas sp. Leaf460]
MTNTLGLDLGTSSLKVLLVGADQAPIATVSVPLSVERPHFGWSEQDPDSWIAACRSALAQLKASHGAEMAAVVGIGLSGHMHGATILGADETPLRPCILWNDTRSHAEAAELDDEAARAITGNIVFPGFTAPKLLWVARNEPAIFEKVRRVLLPKDYLRLWLTGEAVSEMSDSAGTSWLDTGARDWSDAMLARTKLDRSHMPRLVEGTEAGGALRPELAAEFGIPAGTVVAGGGGDNAASACGVGVVRPGSGFLSLGTSGVLFTAAESYAPRPETALHTFCHALPATWHQMGVTLSAAGSLEWLSSVLGETPAALAGAVGDTAEGPGRLLFLPYLSGERTPHNDAGVRGAFVGLEAGTDRAAMTRSVMEGVAFSMRDCLEAGVGRGGIERLIAVGAGSRSPAWLQTMATVLGAEIVLPAAGDFGAALGAARLGFCAATGADPLEVMSEPPAARAFQPSREHEGAFEEAYGRYRALYPAIRSALL